MQALSGKSTDTIVKPTMRPAKRLQAQHNSFKSDKIPISSGSEAVSGSETGTAAASDHNLKSTRASDPARIENASEVKPKRGISPKPFFCRKSQFWIPGILDKFPVERTKTLTKIRNIFLMWEREISKMDPKQEVVQHMMKNLSPGLYKWSPELAKELWAGCFFSDESDDDDKPANKRARGGWKKRRKQCYETSQLWIDHRVNMNCRDPSHVDGKEYRNNYRMPWSEAEKLIQIFKDEGWLEVNETMPTGQKSCPIEIKILGTLYWLGEGCTFRTIRNVAGRILSAQSFRTFALDFCRIVATEIAPLHIRMPESVEELEIINEAYKRRGFPGACGSMDGVQLFWDACPYRLKTTFTGKEKKPTVGFNITVDHDCKFLYVGELFAGRFNDKTKVRYDKYVHKLRVGKFKDVKFNYLDRNGAVQRETGPWLICDNGYHRWEQTLAPCKTTAVPHLAMWSKKLESTRKDVERAFGMTKRRFRILKLPITLRDVRDINFVVLTCFALHNILFDYDAQFAESARDEFSAIDQANRANRIEFGQRQQSRVIRARSRGGLEGVRDEYVVENDDGYARKRERMAMHLHYEYVRRNLIW